MPFWKMGLYIHTAPITVDSSWVSEHIFAAVYLYRTHFKYFLGILEQSQGYWLLPCMEKSRQLGIIPSIFFLVYP